MRIPPDTLLGRYKIRSTLGAGGMGVVFLAEDVELERLVALKVLPAEVSQDTERIHRFVQEAKATSALNHPNILTIYEIGRADGLRFIASEYIKGETLRQKLKREPFGLRESLAVALQVAAALNAAHEVGIVHRDIKPENIVLRDDDLVKVLDFGLAKLTEIKTDQSSVDTEAPTRAHVQTNPGVVLGTVAYMSPEQMRGKETDGRTDIWSLGVCLYEMLSGELPFAGETTSDTIAAILKSEPPLVESAPVELQRIVRKALQKERDERYQTVKDLLIDLKNLKRELEFAEEIERSHIPPFAKAVNVSTNQISAGATASSPAAVATQNSNAYPQSSAEYIIGEVKKHKFISLGALGVLIVALAVGSYFAFTAARPTAINSVAVLPFVNEGNDPNTEYLSDGISESLINNLSQLPQLKVIARSSTFRYKGKEIDPQEVASALGVGAIVTGRIIQQGDSLQISVELVKASDKTQMWGERYNRRAADLLTIQQDIAQEISERLSLRLTGEERQQLAKRYTDNAEAYQLYLRGRYYWNKRKPEDIKRGVEFFQQAIAHDPHYALAHAGLADSYNIMPTYAMLSPREAMPRARAAAQRALEIDETLAEAHTALAWSLARNDWKWAESEREFKRALELNPNYANAHLFYAITYLTSMERFDEVLMELKRTLELDPLSLIANTNLGMTYIYLRQYDRAIEQLRRTLELDPDFPPARQALADAYIAKGMYNEAIAIFHGSPEVEASFPIFVAPLGRAYAKTGRRREAEDVIKRLEENSRHGYVPPYFIAGIHAALGERDEAVASLERAYEERDVWLPRMKVDPAMESLSADPRFQDLVRRIGLTP